MTDTQITLSDLSPATIARTEAGNVDYYGAVGDGATDDTQAFNSALAANKYVWLTEGLTYRIAGTVSVPITTTLDGVGAIIKQWQQGHIITSGDGAVIRNCTINATSQTLQGAERAIRVMNDKVTIADCVFNGDYYRYGILIDADGDTCDDVSIIGNLFSGTSYGVLKQGADGTSVNRLRVAGNKFVNIRHGDAVQINRGLTDIDLNITGNIISNITANSIANAGVGIGISGGYYGGAEADQSGHLLIANNIIRNCDFESIHLEACNRFIITGNDILNTAAFGPNDNGIVCWGSPNGRIINNVIDGCTNGIRDEMGTSAGAYVANSSGGSVIRGNTVDRCSVGIFTGASGDSVNTLTANNSVSGCITGVKHHGRGNISIIRNNIVDCTEPVYIDINPASKAAVNGTNVYARIIGNTSHTLVGVDTAMSDNTLVGFTTTIPATYIDEGNTWSQHNAKAFVSAAQNNNTSGTAKVVALDGESWDSNAHHDTSTNNSRLTCNVAGTYRVTGQVTLAANATGQRYAQVNVSGTMALTGSITDAPAAGVSVSQVHGTVALTRGQYVELLAFQDSTGTLAITTGATNSFLQMERVST